MKKIRMFNLRLLTIVVFVSIVGLSGCSMAFGPDWDWEEEPDYPPIRVVLKVTPDDAQVLLNGKWIGEAWEFSSRSSAIKLATKDNELVVRKEGYVEEAVNLRSYRSRNITVALTLQKDKDYRKDASEGRTSARQGHEVPKRPESHPTQPPASSQPEMKTPPPPEDIDVTKPENKPVTISLRISPVEASIYMNGKFWGIVPESGKIENLHLKPGQYTFEVTKPGYKSAKKVVDVKADTKDAKLDVAINLEKEK